MSCSNDLFVLIYEHRVQDAKAANSPSLLLLEALSSAISCPQRSSWFPHPWGSGRRRGCSQLPLLSLFCLDKIIKRSLKRLLSGRAGCGCVVSGHSSVGRAPLLGALLLCAGYWDRNSAAFKGQIYHLFKRLQRVAAATYWGSHLPSGGRVQELAALSKMMWCTEWCYFSLGSKAS